MSVSVSSWTVWQTSSVYVSVSVSGAQVSVIGLGRPRRSWHPCSQTPNIYMVAAPPPGTLFTKEIRIFTRFNASSVQRLPQAWCQPSWQPGLTTVTQSSQAFHNLRLIHFNVFRMRRPDLLLEQERGTTSLQSSRAYTGFRSGSALSTSSACSCTWCELVAVLRTCRTWWHLSLTCLVVRDWDPPAASDMIQKFSARSFSFSRPKAWNSLPSNLQELTNTDTFKKLLKTHLFKLPFGEFEWLCWGTIGHCRCNWHMKWRNVM